jgi:predicted Rossmann-fold nucleotide-binding protein
MEIITWRQLGLHDKPILIVNVRGWARRMLDMLDGFVADGYSDASSVDLYEVVPDVASVLARLSEVPLTPAIAGARL